MKLRSAAVFCASFLVVLAIVIGVSARRADSYTFTAIDVPGATVTVVSGINDRGEVVGWYRTGSSGDPDSADHGFLLAHGHFTTIDVPGSRGTVAEGINNRGEIVGYYFDQAAAQRGFLLLRGVFTTIECGAFTEPRGINDRGDIVGRLENHGFLFSKGKCTTIDFPGASFSSAFGVNNAGQVVGFYSDATGRHGFLLVHGAFTTIDPPQSV